MSKTHVTGTDKISGNHTTFIEAAQAIIKEVLRLDSVRSVTPGFIESGLKKTQSGAPSVKITMGDDCVKLLVRQAISVQEIYIYTNNAQTTTEFVARTARDLDYNIHFDKRETNELTLRTRRGREMR